MLLVIYAISFKALASFAVLCTVIPLGVIILGHFIEYLLAGTIFCIILTMYDYQPEIEDKALKSVGLELMFMTPEKCNSDKGITAVELAKLVNLPVETVKKKLVILKDAGLVNVKGINPKYWKFDNYNFQRMDEDDDVYRLLCNFDDVDFDRFFQY